MLHLSYRVLATLAFLIPEHANIFPISGPLHILFLLKMPFTLLFPNHSYFISRLYPLSFISLTRPSWHHPHLSEIPDLHIMFFYFITLINMNLYIYCYVFDP